jgi:hypothetical protein
MYIWDLYLLIMDFSPPLGIVEWILSLTKLFHLKKLPKLIVSITTTSKNLICHEL